MRNPATTPFLLSGFALLSLVALAAPDNPPKPAEADTFFEAKVRPLLFENCFGCHGEQQQMRGLRLDSRAAMLKGGSSGPALVPGSPEKSLLLQAVHYTDRLRMPPAGKLSPTEIATLTTWIQQGAVWPTPRTPEHLNTRTPERLNANHWSFQPVRKPKVPTVKNRAWVKTPIDAFILAKLEAKGLTPAPPADKRTLLRRATFDLTGLPPTTNEIRDFLADTSPNAFAKVVDRLLASPAYGERWGRHWLDVVRYADSLDARGQGSEGDIADAWRYRDWVVNALNQDMPYNQFVINQIAGDLLPPSGIPNPPAPFPQGKGERAVSNAQHLSPNTQHLTPNTSDLNVPGTIATGLLAIGNWGNGDADKDKILTDIVDDQIDVTSRAFMGLTMACARCHDHKFDPLSTKDYYGLAGIFFSTHILPKLTPKGAGETPLRVPLLTQAEKQQRAQYATQLADLEKRLKTETETHYHALAKSLLPETAHYLVTAWDYSNRPTEQAKLSLAEFATQRNLQEYAVRQWADFLGAGEYRMMTTSLRDLLNSPGVHAWKGEKDTPSLTVNTTAEARTLLTFTLPPRSVSIHPSPSAGVAVGWRSPIAGKVQITGRVADADPACGNGIAWMVEHQTAAGVRELASGEIENGGKQDFLQGKGAASLASVTVKAGESIRLVVLPKGEYSCDTTTVELALKAEDGRLWSLTQDLVADPLLNGNGSPHPDQFGNPGVWRFYDMAGGDRFAVTGKDTHSPQALWRQTLAQVAPNGTPSREALSQAAETFARSFDATDARSPFYPAGRADEKALPPDARQTLDKLATDLETLKKQPPPPTIYANGAQEGGVPESPHAGIHDVRVHLRGSYLRLGDLVPRRFPVILAGTNQPPITKGSGRLELARWIASPRHPLTSRVIVNRIWQGHFGQGIVRTPSNFGFLGERPTHPELLDWLATAFTEEAGVQVFRYSGIQERASTKNTKIHEKPKPPPNPLLRKEGERVMLDSPPSLVRNERQGKGVGGLGKLNWSLKQLHRLILLSATYQQASVAPPLTMQRDPDNRLLGRMSRRRLEAEAIRDNLLAVTGRLDRTMGGMATRDFSSPRRTLYIMTIRSERSGFGPLFDVADSTASVEKRTVSTVAPQALYLLNSPFVLEQAQAFAKRLQADITGSETARIQTAYQRLYGRPATGAEVKLGLAFLQRGGTTAWEAYSQLLLCANEFLYID